MLDWGEELSKVAQWVPFLSMAVNGHQTPASAAFTRILEMAIIVAVLGYVNVQLLEQKTQQLETLILRGEMLHDKEMDRVRKDIRRLEDRIFGEE